MNDAPERDITEWVRLREEGLTYDQIGEKVGKNGTTVWHALVGLVPPVKEVRVQYAIALRELGKSWDEVADIVGYKDGHSARCAVYKFERYRRARSA